jgi:hypothetical protein
MGRTEIEFFDSVCSVQTNLPVPKQNEVYYWETKIYDMPENTEIGIGFSTKPYPLFRLPGMYIPCFFMKPYKRQERGTSKHNRARVLRFERQTR